MMASHRTAWVQGLCWCLQLFNNYNMRTIMRWQKYTLGDGIMSWFLQGARECIWNCKGSAKSFLPETFIVANSARQMNPSPYCHIYAYMLNSGGEEFQKKTQKKMKACHHCTFVSPPELLELQGWVCTSCDGEGMKGEGFASLCSQLLEHGSFTMRHWWRICSFQGGLVLMTSALLKC